MTCLWNRKSAYAGTSYFLVAERVNVFVGAYATEIARLGPAGSLPFRDFLETVAPYSNETEAQRYLQALGIAVVSSTPKTPKDQGTLDQVSMKLEGGYDSMAVSNPSFDKAPILIKHEARQLALLSTARVAGRRAYFITADKKLRAIVDEEVFGGLRDAVLSPMSFVQLIDLLVGVDIQPSSLARVFWSVRAVDEEGVLRNYLLDLALKNYDAALLLDMGDVLNQTIYTAKKHALLEEVQLMPSDVGDENAGKTTRFLDRVEESFFSEMAKEMKRRESERQQ